MNIEEQDTQNILVIVQSAREVQVQPDRINVHMFAWEVSFR